MNRQLKKHIETNNLLSKNQHAYQTAKSCSTAWADIDVFVNQALDKNKLVPALLLDMSAAFNLVSRHIIVPKLKLLGVGPYAAQLVDSYLTGRQNVTKIKQYMSEYVKVHTGIGEGSVLGPLIFILTIVCLQAVLERVRDRVQQALGVNVSTDPLWSETDVIKLMQTIFADDCTPMAACDTVEQAQTILEIMLDEYTQYFKSNGLKVNFTKCEHVIFSRQSRPRTVKMGDRMEASHVKLLGLTVSNTYTFDKHVSLVNARMTARLPYLARLKPLLEPSKMRQVSEAVSLSVMRYAMEIYCSSANSQHKVQVSMNRVMRLLLSGNSRTSVATMLGQLNWVNTKIQYNLSKLMLLRSLVIHRTSDVVMGQLTAGQLAHQHNVRARQWQIAWRPHYARMASSYLPSTVMMFNTIQMNRAGLGTKLQYRDTVKSRLVTLLRNTNV